MVNPRTGRPLKEQNTVSVAKGVRAKFQTGLQTGNGNGLSPLAPNRDFFPTEPVRDRCIPGTPAGRFARIRGNRVRMRVVIGICWFRILPVLRW